MYILIGTPATPNEYYNTLNEVFGANTFSTTEAQDALVRVHDITPEEAMRELSALRNAGVIGEA
jgi:hypothetical protein